MTPCNEALNLASPLIHNERQNIPHDIHLSLSDHVIYGRVPSGLYTRDITHSDEYPIRKFPCKRASAKGPPPGSCMRGGGRARGERVGLSAHCLDQSGFALSQAGLQTATARSFRRTEVPSRANEPPHLHAPSHPHVLAPPHPTDGRTEGSTNGPSASVPPFMTTVGGSESALVLRWLLFISHGEDIVQNGWRER